MPVSFAGSAKLASCRIDRRSARREGEATTRARTGGGGFEGAGSGARRRGRGSDHSVYSFLLIFSFFIFEEWFFLAGPGSSGRFARRARPARAASRTRLLPVLLFSVFLVVRNSARKKKKLQPRRRSSKWRTRSAACWPTRSSRARGDSTS